ncbi:cupredoxin domain-containing protein [Defluviimonas salinarum]|uniref:Plastocyanin/azurin family copper-binding protein n=1 Tax=Defluviimonas salinarum TaxID=2992147 RepID=A0ABT3JAK6_9RHOB|nr:plastocyanin/azurin family copper-binding protein [Defluviimonas salinarum]MCW3784726.1 plastocyanin/azurin family copper-binding protein [Defluviimonas salinarum]
MILSLGGGALATLTMSTRVRAATFETIEMRGTARGERIWFAPHGLAVAPGTSIRFVNRDPGNSHTATAYHPNILNRKRRIPKGARPWDSDYLLPGDSYEIVLTAPGVYDYYCQPHEMAGMVGRIVVGWPDDSEWEGPSDDAEDVMPEVLAALPAVADILRLGRIDLEVDE